MVEMTDEITPLPTDPVARFEDFFRQFEPSPNTFLYHDAIKKLDANRKLSGERSLQVDFNHLAMHSTTNNQISQDLLENPEWLKKFDQALVNILHDFSPGEVKLTDTYFIRLYNLPQNCKVKLSKISGEEHIGKINYFNVTISGTDPLQTEKKIAHFECKICGATHDVIQYPELLEPLAYPAICNVGGCKNAKQADFRLLSTNNDVRDIRTIRVQENADESDPAKDPDIKEVELRDELARMDVHIGDRVRIVGIVRGRQLKKENREILYIEGINIVRDVKPLEELEVSQGDEDQIRARAKKPDVMDLLIRSVAPHLYGLEYEKAGGILSMFGGVKRIEVKTGKKIRGNIQDRKSVV
jgi:replicative DNA helicase Mcm